MLCGKGITNDACNSRFSAEKLLYFLARRHREPDRLNRLTSPFVKVFCGGEGGWN